MPQICLYLHLHQPHRLKEFSVEELGNQNNYFFAEHDLNQEVFEKITQKSYVPMLRLLEQMVYSVEPFKVSFSITGLWVEQAERYHPELLDILYSIMQSGKAEILAETYYHSLASLYSEAEFKRQVESHVAMVKERFSFAPTTFRNTELVYSNNVAVQVARLGFKGILTEGVDRVLQGRPRTRVYYSVGEEQLPILLKQAQLSDDIAFRFSDKSWQWFPLSAEKYLEWVEVYGENEIVNLFMDFETFGEHQWADTGIFDFFTSFVRQASLRPWNTFVTPADVYAQAGYRVKTDHFSNTAAQVHNEKQLSDGAGSSADKSNPSEHTVFPSPLPDLRYDVPTPISWADVDRDLTAWLENAFQQDCIEQIYAIESEILHTGSPELIADWRRLQASDHYYYMCTKWSADGDVHAYFSPYQDPFEAYRRFSIVLADIKHRLWTYDREANQTHVLAPPHLRMF